MPGAGDAGRPGALGAELARTLPIFMTGVPARAVRVEPRADATDEALELGMDTNLPIEGEREVRRCLRGASGDGELAMSESSEIMSALMWPSLPIIASTS